MSKALEILKRQLDYYEYLYEIKKEIDLEEYEELSSEVNQAIAELETFKEENKILKHNYDVQVEYNNTAYKNYTNMVNSLEQRIEAMKPKTCLDCKHYSQSIFYGDVKVTKYCHENRLGIDDINFKIFCCNRYEPKDNA